LVLSKFVILNSSRRSCFDLCTASHFSDDNKRILEELEVDKQPYTFECDDLLILMGCTTSVKTKLAMVTAIAPRLMDPKSKMDLIINSFRFAEEKEIAGDALRSRITVLTGSIFKKNLMNNARGGRGGATLATAGRGAGSSAKVRITHQSSSVSPNNKVSSERQQDSDDEEDEDNGADQNALPAKTAASSLFANAEAPQEDIESNLDNSIDDTVVAVDQIYGQPKSEAEIAASAVHVEEEEYYEGDSDDDLPPVKSTTEAAKPQESFSTSVFRAFGFGGSKS
jgi:hypothetical protein